MTREAPFTCCCGREFPNRKELYMHLARQTLWTDAQSATEEHAEPPKPGARVRLVQRDTAGCPPYGTEGTVVVEVGGSIEGAPNSLGVKFDGWKGGHALGGKFGLHELDPSGWWCRARQLEVLP